MDDEPPDRAGDPREGRFLHVSTLQFWGSLAVALAIFLFSTGPLWRHAADIGRLDVAIFWSYGAIPLLIGGCLLASKRWSWRGFLLDTMALTLTKYVVTLGLAIAFWALGNAPQGASPSPWAPRVAHAEGARAAELPAPTPIDPARTGTLAVTVADAAGGPVPGALVYVAGGLEGMVFAPPSAPLVLGNDGHGVTPALSVAEVGQRLEGRSTDGRLHTLVVRRDGAPLFNVPLLSSGAPTTVRAGDEVGLATVRCNVHPGAEGEARLLLLANPFHALTDAAGRATFRGVPAGTLRVAALVDGGRSGAEETVKLAPGGASEARIVAPRP